MKKFSLLAGCLVLLCNCSQTDTFDENCKERTGIKKVTPDLLSTALMGKVKSISTYSYDAKIMFGEITPIRTLSIDSVTYDIDGFELLDRTDNIDDGKYGYAISQYDKRHNRIRFEHTSSYFGPVLSDTTISTFDEYNNVTYIVNHGHNGNYTLKYSYEYDEFGRKTLEIFGDKKRYYQYNSLGFILDEKHFEKDVTGNDSLTRHEISSYLNDSLLARKVIFSKNDSSVYFAEFDSLGVKTYERDDRFGLRPYERRRLDDGSYLYVQKGGDARIELNGRIMSIESYNKRGCDQETETFEYDQWGNVIKRIVTRTRKGIYDTYVFPYKYTYEYKYDSHNNWVKMIQYAESDNNGKEIKEYIVRNIEYYK